MNLLTIYAMILGLIAVPTGIYFGIWAIADLIRERYFGGDSQAHWRMQKVAKLLGIHLGQEFRVTGLKQDAFRLTEYGLFLVGDDSGVRLDYLLVSLLLGRETVSKD